MRAHVLLRRAPTLVIALIVVLAFSACSASPRGVQSSPTSPTAATQAPTPLPTQPVNHPPSPVAGLLGPAPTNCPVVSPPSTHQEADFGGGFIGSVTFSGSAPAWELGLGTTLQVDQNGAEPYPSTKVMWVVGPNYAQPVTLTGHELQTGAALWFQVYPSNGVPTSNPDAQSVYTTHAVLDPAAPNRGSTDNSTGHWNIWGIGIIVLTAGCYELDVTSAAGSWRMVFAAGR